MYGTQTTIIAALPLFININGIGIISNLEQVEKDSSYKNGKER
jgi:1,4-dihydroxy-2-naphthoate octaprenyltransferase